MAGRPQRRTQQQSGPTYGATLGDLLRQGAMLSGARPPDPEQRAVEDAIGEVGRTVANRARMARLTQANQMAQDILSPPQGVDPVSREALETAVSAHKGVADTYRQQAAEAMARSASVDERVSAASQAGFQAARALNATELSAMERVAGMAVETVKSLTAAQSDAVARAAAAEVRAAESQAGFFRDLATSLLSVVTQQQRAPNASPPADTMQSMVAMVDGVRKLQAAIAPAQPAGLTWEQQRQRDWDAQEAARLKERDAGVLSLGKEAIPHLGKLADVLTRRGGGGLPPPDASGAVNGIPSAPPPAPGGAQ